MTWVGWICLLSFLRILILPDDNRNVGWSLSSLPLSPTGYFSFSHSHPLWKGKQLGQDFQGWIDMFRFLYSSGNPLGQFCFLGNTWLCLEPFLVVTTTWGWRGRSYWRLPTIRAQRCLQNVLLYKRQPSHNKELPRIVCSSLLGLP